jgi:ubiquinone/menaquinone biosynthesis C-methylase UbiE
MNNLLQEVAVSCVCPKCNASLMLTDNEFQCNECGCSYPVRDGIPELLAATSQSEVTVTRLSKLYNAGAQKYNHSPKSCGYTTNDAFRHSLNILSHWVWADCLSGLKVLDVGCGTGLMTQPLVKNNQVWGVDISAGLLQAAREKSIRTILASADALPFPDNYFDLVVCMGVMPYYTDPQPICRQLARVMKPNGQIVISSTTNSWLIRGVRFIKNRLWMKSQLKRLYTPEDLKKALTSQGILVTDTCMGYNDRIFSCKKNSYPMAFRALARIAAAFGTRPA